MVAWHSLKAHHSASLIILIILLNFVLTYNTNTSTNMNKSVISTILSLLLLASCSDKKSTAISEATDPNEPEASVSLKGKWDIENIVFSDSDYVRPSEAVPGSKQFVVFTDSTYFFATNCNSISGYYAIKGDTISLSDGAMTEMACDNMETEDALRRILPSLTLIDVENDSTVRLNCNNTSGYIILRKNTVSE